MCGIAGLCAPGGRVDLGRLQKMSSLLSHRGPDDEGAVLCDPSSGAWLTLGGGSTPADAWKSGVRWAPGRSHGDVARARFEVGIAHRRLSIVDLSPAGHQPMCDGEANAWISFNGEIYNWVELRQELESLGDRFTTASDTEVLLAAYARWGERCLDRLNGMFALAIWDARARQLFCARDRFGVKPFYWQIENGALAFASEARALALTQSRRPQPRAGAIRDLLALDWVDHDARTFFDGIFQLQPGHFLRFGERGLDVRQWWSLPSDRHAPGSMADWLAEFEELFTDAVRLRLRADVEVGSCLEAGVEAAARVHLRLRRRPRVRRAPVRSRDGRGERRAFARRRSHGRRFLGDVRPAERPAGRADRGLGALLAMEGDGARAFEGAQGAARRAGRR
jgi:asparagine synthase (glutamine-hydrolysing)